MGRLGAAGRPPYDRGWPDVAAWDIEAERQTILRVLPQAPADPYVAKDPGRARLLANVRYGLAQSSVLVAWCGHCVRAHERRFHSRCLAVR